MRLPGLYLNLLFEARRPSPTSRIIATRRARGTTTRTRGAMVLVKNPRVESRVVLQVDRSRAAPKQLRELRMRQVPLGLVHCGRSEVAYRSAL